MIQEEKKLPEGLEEAAKNRVTENERFPISEFEEMRIRDIKFGAEWQKAKMLKDAVEGKVAERIQGKLYARCQIPNTMGVEFGDKVRVIVIKED